MKKCVWVRPKLVAVIEFLEWTEGDRLRHSKFVGLRDGQNPLDVGQRGLGYARQGARLGFGLSVAISGQNGQAVRLGCNGLHCLFYVAALSVRTHIDDAYRIEPRNW